MNKYSLPTSVEINGVECPFNSDFRDILKIFEIFNDPDLTENERVYVALKYFYTTEDYAENVEEAVDEMLHFVTMSDTNEKQNSEHSKPLYSWEQDYNIIIAPINNILGFDVRGKEYLHWWTFLSAFMEIGESTFNTYVGIRDKLNRGKKLEKYEEKILKDNRDRIILKKKVDSTTQSLMDEIMGV